MTVIAWDGVTLAADRRALSAGYGYTVTKLHVLADGSLAGFSGDGDGAMALLHWLNGDRKSDEYPAAQKDNDVCAFVAKPDGSLWSYGKTPWPLQIKDPFYAMGHGRDFALAAMYLGKNAREAVEVTCALDVHCGNGITTLEFKK